MKKKMLLLLLLISTPLLAGEIAVTMDDLPIAYGRHLNKAEEVKTFKKILDVLDKHGVKVVGFAVGSLIQPYHKPLMDEFLKRGHTVGNHTYGHPDLNAISIEDYKENITQGEQLIQSWLKGTRFFRFPMLHRGNTVEKKTAIEAFLKEHNYRAAPVTIDNDEWLFNIDYINAIKKGDKAEAQKVSRAYLAHMQERTSFFQKMAKTKLNRDIRHILLTHWNYLNAANLDELLIWYTENGWSFISLEEALEDEVYSKKDNYLGMRGLSWLERI